jgi:hypothetical protein
MGRQLSETRIAGLHLPVALSLIAVGVGHLVVEGLQPFTVLRAAFPLALGGFVVLVIGTSRMLLSGRANVAVAGRRAWWVPGLAATVGSLGLYAAFGGRAWLLSPAALLWGAGLGLHVGLLGFSLARARQGASVVDGWPALSATVAGLGYGLAAAVAIPSVPLLGFGLLAALHLVLTGFVVLAIAAVVLGVLPGITGRAIATPVAGVLAVGLSLGPMLLAEGLNGSALQLRLGAIVEGIGLVGLGGVLVWSTITSERERASFWLYGAAGISILLGATLGAAIVMGWTTRGQAPWHGAVTLLGFVGLVVLGAVMDLFAPALKPRADPIERHNLTVVGVALTGMAGLVAVPLVPGWTVRVALVAYLAAVGLHLVGSLARLQR